MLTNNSSCFLQEWKSREEGKSSVGRVYREENVLVANREIKIVIISSKKGLKQQNNRVTASVFGVCVWGGN